MASSFWILLAIAAVAVHLAPNVGTFAAAGVLAFLLYGLGRNLAHNTYQALLAENGRDGEPLFKVPNDPRITKLLQSTRVIVQPMTNVDGYNNSRQAVLDELVRIAAA